jgi:hypothetical protein
MRRYFAAFFLLAVASASATPYDLKELVSGTAAGAGCTVGALVGSCFTVGDKTFNFQSAGLTGSGVTAPLPPLAIGQFSVNPLLSSGSLFGFQILGGMTADSVNGSTANLDLALSYTVATTSGQALMTDLHAELNGNCVVVGGGTCLVQATENATNAAGHTVNGIANGGNVLVTNPLLVNLSNTPQTDLFLSPQSLIQVTKDITVFAHADTNGEIIANLSIISQYVSQVPEPGFYGALALGLSGLTFLVRRRRRAA